MILNKDSEFEFSSHHAQPGHFNQLSPQAASLSHAIAQKQQHVMARSAYPAGMSDHPLKPVSQPLSSFRRRTDAPSSDAASLQQPQVGPTFAGPMATSNGGSSLQHHSIAHSANTMRFTAGESRKPMTLKARMQQTMRQQSAYVQPTLTKQELKELKKMNENREMFTLLEKTSGPNTHLKYLTGRSRLVSAVAGGGAVSAALRSRSGSRVSTRIKSAHSRKTSSSGEHNFMKHTKSRVKTMDKTQR